MGWIRCTFLLISKNLYCLSRNILAYKVTFHRELHWNPAQVSFYLALCIVYEIKESLNFITFWYFSRIFSTKIFTFKMPVLSYINEYVIINSIELEKTRFSIRSTQINEGTQEFTILLVLNSNKFVVICAQ